MNVSQIQRKHIQFVMDWCVDVFGKSSFMRKIPSFRLIKKRKWDWRGEYNPENNTITIVLLSHSSVVDVIDTVIHEFSHYRQDMVMYDIYTDVHRRSYEKHPYEISANNKAEKYREQCKQALLKAKL